MCAEEIELAGKRAALRFGLVGRVRCEPGWNWTPQLGDYDLWFVWAGRGRMRIEGEPVELAPGSVFWLRPGRRYAAEQDEEARLGVTYLHFELLERGRALSGSGWTPPFEAVRTRRAEVHDAALRRTLELLRAGEGGGAAARWFAAVLTDLAEEARSEHAAGTGVSGVEKHHDEVIARVIARIREAPGDAPPVAELAREAGYSTDHFARVFARVAGEGPQEFVIRAKMERARQLLGESSLSVGMVAEALGFRDVFFFSRQFKQRTGMTPTEFRRGARPTR